MLTNNNQSYNRQKPSHKLAKTTILSKLMKTGIKKVHKQEMVTIYDVKMINIKMLHTQQTTLKIQF